MTTPFDYVLIFNLTMPNGEDAEYTKILCSRIPLHECIDDFVQSIATNPEMEYYKGATLTGVELTQNLNIVM